MKGEKVIGNGFDLAQYSLANWLMSGSYDIKVDESKAFELYQMASSQNHAPSWYLLAKCYQDGIGTEKNNEKAREAYEKASLLGDSRASYVLGYAYIYGGIGIESNPHLFLNGIELLKACADNPQGDFYRDALYELSILHSGSKKTKSLIKDPLYSLSCLTRAANLGHDKSQFRLGYNYEFGLLELPVDASRYFFISLI
jgi:TPR repeat protein